jgi:hypothetical protein
MKPESSLSISQLLSLDTIITIAQERGLGLDDKIKTTNEQAEAVAEIHEAMWEARHGAFWITDHDQEILGRIKELASQLESETTLGALITMRGEALRQMSQVLGNTIV